MVNVRPGLEMANACALVKITNRDTVEKRKKLCLDIVDKFKATKKDATRAVEEGKAIFRETGKALQDQLDFIQKKDI